MFNDFDTIFNKLIFLKKRMYYLELESWQIRGR